MKIARIISTSRPRFWIYELGPYVVGLVAALSVVPIPALVSVPVIAFFVYFLFPANVLIYGVNDIYDYETDRLNPKKVAYESLLMPAEHRTMWLIVLLTTLPFVAALPFSNNPAVVFFAAFLFFAIGYSAEPIRAKTKPLLDMFFSAGHYVATGAFGYALLSGLWPTPTALIAGMLWAMAMHAYSAIPDIRADSEAGFSTVATLLCKKGTLGMCSVFYGVSSVLGYVLIGPIAIALGVVYEFLMVRSFFTHTDEGLFRLYTYFPTINTIAGMVLFFTVLLL